MNEQVLKDLVATAQTDGYSWDTITPKFPELAKFDEQVLKDYVATAEQDNYDYSKINSKFPEFEFEEVSIEETKPKKNKDTLKNSKALQFDRGLFKMSEREAYDKYKLTGEIDLELIPIEEDKPGFIQDKLARLARGIASTGKGFEEAKTALFLTGTDIAIDIFKPELTKEQKLESLKALKKLRDTAPGSGVSGYNKAIETLGNYVREYDSESITDDIKEGRLLQAADRTIGGVFESAPSLALAYLGIGGLIGLGTSAAGNKFDEEFEQNPEEGAKRLFLNAVGTGITEAAFERVTAGILGKARFLRKSGNKKAAEELLDSYAKNTIKRFATDPAKEGLSEAATELSIDLVDIATLQKDEWPGLSDFVDKNIKKWSDAGIIGTATGGGIVTTKALTSNSKAVRDAAEYTLTPNSDKKIIQDAAININNLNDQIKQLDNEDNIKILEAEIVKEEEKIINTRKKVSQELNMMNPDELKEYAKNIDKINKSKKDLNSKSIFANKTNEQSIENLENLNSKLIRESVDRRIKEVTKTVDVKEIGRTVNVYNKTEDFQKAFDNTKTGKKTAINVGSADGFIDEEGNIYVNKPVSQKYGNVNVAAHELLHGIIANNIQEPGQLNKLVDEFKATLPKDQLEKIQKRIDDNYRFERDEEGNVVRELKKEEYNEEYFTAFADLIGNRQIKFNENIFTKIGDFLTPIFTRKGYGNIKFETGRDVYDFIKSYQKQIAKGELKPETIEAAKKVTDQDVKMSRSEITDLAKQYKADPANTDVEKLVNQYNNVALKALGYDISKGTIAPEEAISFVNKEFNNILRRYDGSTEFSTWVNSNIRPKRQAFYDEQIGKQAETTSIDSEQARQVVDDSETTTDDRTEKEIRQAERKIKVAKRLNLEDKAIKEVSKKVKDVDLSKVNYKTLKNLANETIGEAFGISPNKILNNANLTKGEIANAQRYIKNNVDLLKALLPDGYNKDFKSTGVPKVLLDKFYNKRSVRAKTGAGLNVQIKKPNIGSNEFLEVFGFVDGKPTRDDRNISARIIALANQTGKAITNQTVREQLQKEGMPESALQDIKSGTPTAMFSFTTRKNLNWKTDEAGNMNASFNINNKKYNIELYPVDDEGDYRLNFNLETKDGTTEEITGTGDSFKVISTVYNGIVDEIESNSDIKSFQFESDKAEPTRVRLYTTLMNKFADELGWESDIYESTRYDGTGSFDFELVKPKRSKSVKFSDSTKLSEKDISELKNLSTLRSINDATKKINIKGKVTVSDATRPTIQGKILKAFESGGLGLTAFESMMPASAGAKSNRRKNGDKYYKLSNGEEILGQRVLDKNDKQVKDKKGKKRFKPPTIKQIAKKYGEGVTLVPDGGRIYYGVTDPEYVKARQTAIKNDSENNYQRIPVGKEPIGKTWLNKKNRKGLTPKEQGELNFKAFKQAMLEIEKAVQEGSMDIETAALMIAQGYQATAGIIKGVAGFKYRSRNMEFAKTRKQATGKVPFREEHNPPASVIGANLIWAIKNKKVKALMPFIKKNYYQTQLSLADDLLLDLARLDATLVEGTSILDNPIIRFAVAGINLNSIINIETGKSIIDEFGLGVSRYFENFPGVIAFQNNLVKRVILEGLDVKQAKKELDQYLKIAPQQQKANKFSKSMLNNSKVLDVEGNLNIEDLLSKAASIDEALNIARDVNAPVKKIRVFDFDDTLATTKSNVLFTAPDGSEGSLTAEEFARDGARLIEEGYIFDFTEFDKVTKGKPGPLLDIAKKIQAARGTEDVFVLTARAPEAAIAIKEFLDSQGLNIPLENITGLGKSNAEAKANWMIDKAAEGYNDFYFADDAYQNVKAVRDVMSVIDVKSKTQQAKFSLSRDLNSDFNKILENKSGIGAEKVYSDAKAKTVGASKGKFKFFIPPSAEDFVGLLYPTLAKGRLGDQQMAWYKERLLNPFARAMENLSRDRVNLMNDFKALKKDLDVPKDLRKKNKDGFTNEQAVRVYLWNKQGLDIPGLSKADLKELSDIVESNPKLKVFADQLQAINKSDGYPAPQESWLVGTITTDLINGLNTVKRTKYLEEWQTNADIIFSKENLNKMEAIYGAKYREAMENILSRMKTGKNRLFSESRIGNQVLDYINGSIGAIMFFNTRSAVLQTISSINFINWSDNNIYKAGKAFANQPQYWKDFTTLMNSDFLKDRRQGLKLNISESEIADAAKTSKNKAKAALNYILQKGFLPTQIADSFAIASGGATYYRNRINNLVKEGMSQKEAEEQAFRDFREIAEESQQSSRPDRISQQQASNVGRVILAFANTPSQYARIIKKAVSDLKNKRGDWKNNVSKIIYYGAMQNLIFNVLQQALFAVGFGDDEEETEKREKKYVGIANGMVDSLLRGLGYGGAAVAAAKNLLVDVYERSKRDRPEYVDSAWKLLDFSPPIDSKVSKLKSAGYMVDKYGDDMIDKGFAIDNPAYEAASKVVSATTNVPLDRVFNKANNISAAMGEDAETWQRVAMMLGWPKWQINPKDEKKTQEAKQIKGKYYKTSF